MAKPSPSDSLQASPPSSHSPAVAEPSLNVLQALAGCGTDKRLAVLRGVANTGSISEAARQVGVSYKSAWQAIETLTNLANTALVEKVVGGAGGGGARLTSAGEGLLEACAQWQSLQQAWLKQLGNQPLSPSLAGFAAVGLRMQTSMRNQWPVTVERCEVAAGRSRVELRLSDGQRLWAQITPESQQLLGLAPGLSVVAMCKASAVSVFPAQGASAARASNCLQGNVRRLDGEFDERQNVQTNGGASGAISEEVSVEVSVAVTTDVCLLGYGAGDHTLKAGARVLVEVDPMAVVIARELSVN